MADLDITLKRRAGGAYDVLYPTTTWTQVESKPTTFTPTAHTHVTTDISNSGNVGRNLLTTSSATASTLFFKKNPDHTITLEDAATFRTSTGTAATSHTHGNITNAGAIGSTADLAVVTTTSGVLTTRSVSDSSTATVLGTTTNLVTERDVYNGVHYIEIGVSAAIASSTTFTTLSFTSGMRDFWLYIHQDTTTGAVIARLPLTIATAQSIGTATPGKLHRVEWSNGSTAQRMNVDVYYSGTTLYFRHSFVGASLAFRWIGI
jgi:hypothetical protein